MKDGTRNAKLLTAVAMAAVVAVGALYYGWQSRQLADLVARDLASVAHLKASQIAAWYAERIGDGEALAGNPVLGDAVARWRRTGSEVEKTGLVAALSSLCRSYGYCDVLLCGPDGSVLYTGGAHRTTVPEQTATFLVEATRSRRAMVQDLHTDANHAEPALSVVASLADSSGAVVGGLVLVMPVRGSLYRLLATWPTPSATGETLLVERSGDDVVYLSEPRFGARSASFLRRPLNQRDLVSAQAILRPDGALAGHDYRGVRVAAASEKVAGTPWTLVAKLDESEAYDVWHRRGALILLITVVAALLAGAAGQLAVLGAQRRHYQALYEAEEARRATEATYRALVDALPDVVEREDREGRHLYITPNVTYLGLDPDEVVGRTHAELGFTAEQCAFFAAATSRVFESGQPYLTDAEMMGPNGPMTIEWRIVPEFDERGEVSSILGVVRDITEHRRLEQRTRQLADMLDTAPGAVLVVDQQGALVYANRGAGRMHGYTAEEFAHLNLADLVVDGDANAAVQRLQQAAEEDGGQLTVEHRRRNGGSLPLAVATQAVVWHGQPAYLMIGTDITERQLVERTHRFLLESSAPGADEDFFGSLAEYLADALSADFICIDELLPDGESARTVAVWFDGRLDENMTYPLRGTPCGQVTEDRFCWHPAGVSALYPADDFLSQMGAECYAGTLLWGSGGQPIGLIAVIWREPGDDGASVEAVLKLVGVRAAGEMERRHAEAALRRQEALLADASQMAGFGAWTVSADTREVTWSDELYRLFDLPTDRTPTLATMIEQFDGESRVALAAALEAVLAGGQPFGLELVACTASGFHRDVHIVGRAEYGDGRVVAVAGACQDITGRKQTERMLRLRVFLQEYGMSHTPAELWQFTLDQVGDLLDSPIGFFHRVDADQEHLLLCAWSTRTLREFCQTEAFGAHYPLSEAGVWADSVRLRRAVVHNDYAHLAGRRGLPDGHAQVLREVVVPILREGLVVAVMGVGNKPTNYTEQDVETISYLANVAWDAIDRLQAEEALRERDEQLRLALASAQMGTWQWDIRADRRTYGPNCAALLGLDAGACSGSGEEFLAAVHPDDRTAVALELSLTVAEALPYSAEFRTQRPDGTVRHVAARGALSRDAQDQPVRLMGVLWDVTAAKEAEADRERLERSLTQAQKMESVGRLAGGVAHDFNNMLSVIQGHVEMALEQAPADSALREDLLEVQEAAERSAELTRQLLAFARRQTVEPRVVDLNEWVGGSLKMLRRLIGEDINLTWRPGASLWPVHVDPAQVNQVMANLCVNARDAIGGVGVVDIATANLTVRADDATFQNVPPGDYATMTVRDNGCGMDAATLASIFEPFFTTKAVGQGTGLGLATVYGVVQQAGGFIQVASAPGRGSSFHILLPRWREVAGAEVAHEPDGVLTGSETILMVEDEAAILHIGRRILIMAGYEVLSANSPAEAEALASHHAGRVDLLLTDVIMPQMSGRELADRLTARYPGLRTAFMSGYTADVIARHGVLDPGVAFIQKPFTRQSLLRKVRETLDAR